MFISAEEAWTVLGFKPKELFKKLQELPRKDRVAAARLDLESARKAAKKLLAVHHPDVGGDAEKFRRVNEAIQAIEYHIEDFSKKMSASAIQQEERNAKRPVFIKIEK